MLSAPLLPIPWSALKQHPTPPSQGHAHVYYPASMRLCVLRVCVCYGEVAASFQAWLIVHCALYTCIHINLQMYSSKHLGSLILCFQVSASSAAAPSDRLAAVSFEKIKGEVTVIFEMSTL